MQVLGSTVAMLSDATDHHGIHGRHYLVEDL